MKSRHPLIDEVARIQGRDGLSGSDVARLLAVNPSTVTRLLSGEMQPSLRIVQAVNEQFPELRVRCAELLRIGIVNHADEQDVISAGAV
jgi:predicted transcriptional regulator